MQGFVLHEPNDLATLGYTEPSHLCETLGSRLHRPFTRDGAG